MQSFKPVGKSHCADLKVNYFMEILKMSNFLNSLCCCDTSTSPLSKLQFVLSTEPTEVRQRSSQCYCMQLCVRDQRVKVANL